MTLKYFTKKKNHVQKNWILKIIIKLLLSTSIIGKSNHKMNKKLKLKKKIMIRLLFFVTIFGLFVLELFNKVKLLLFNIFNPI